MFPYDDTNRCAVASAGAVEVFDLKKLKAVAVAEIGKQAGGIAFWKMTD